MFDIGLEVIRPKYEVPLDWPMEQGTELFYELNTQLDAVTNLITIRQSIQKYGKTPQLMDLVGASFEVAPTVIRKESDINSVSDLKNFFTHCRYGLVDTSTGKLWKETHKNTTKQDYYDHWKLLSPSEVVKHKCGICYDTVLLTKTVFDRLNIKYRTYYAYCTKDDGPTHTFVIYQDNNEWKWMEGSWSPFKRNDFVSSSSNTIVSWIGKTLANASGIQQQILELRSYPKPGVTMKEFQEAVLKGSKCALIDPDRGSNSNRKKE